MDAGSDIEAVLFVKKLLAGGEPCAKCRGIERRLRKDDLMQHLSGVLPAREDDPSSPGAQIAAKHGVQRAPFFVLRHADGEEEVIESYLAFKQRFSGKAAAAGDPADLADIVDSHPELALI